MRMDSCSTNMLNTFVYQIYKNVTFDPTLKYKRIDGYKPGALLELGYTGPTSGHLTMTAVVAQLFQFSNGSFQHTEFSEGDLLAITNTATGKTKYFAMDWLTLEFTEVEDPANVTPMENVCHIKYYEQNKEYFESMFYAGVSHDFIESVGAKRS